MKKLFVCIICAFLLIAHSAFAEEMKIASVDLIKALNESEEGKKAKADLEYMIQSKQTSINEKGQTIEKLRVDMEKQASVLSPDAKKTKEDELERMIREYQRMVQDAQNEVKKKEGEFTAKIIKELRALIQTYGKEQGLSMIIENADGIVLYVKDALDLTDEVIKRYNTMKKEDKTEKKKENGNKEKK